MQKRGKVKRTLKSMKLYGWITLLLIVLLVSLAAYGIFRTPSARRCGYDGVLMNGLFCEDFKISSDPAIIQVRLRNGLGYAISIDNIKAVREDDNSCFVCYDSPAGSILKDGEERIYVLDGNDGCTGNSREKYKGKIYLEYSKVETGISLNGFGSFNLDDSDAIYFDGQKTHVISAPIEGQIEPGEIAVPYCDDSDGGKVYDVQGTTSIIGDTESETDYCTGTTLTEYFCDGTNIGSENVNCPDIHSYWTVCQNGECQEAPYPECSTIPPDDGSDPLVYGICDDENPGTLADSCISGTVLNETYCDATGYCNYTIVDCRDVYCTDAELCDKCFSGKCILSSVCSIASVEVIDNCGECAWLYGGTGDCDAATDREECERYDNCEWQNPSCNVSDDIKIKIGFTQTCLDQDNPVYVQVDAMSDEGYCYGIPPELDSIDCNRDFNNKASCLDAGCDWSPALCNIEYTGGDIRGMETTCTNNICSDYWTIPGTSIPEQCLGMTVYGWAAGLYDEAFPADPTPDWFDIHYLTGIYTDVNPGYGHFTFIGAEAPPEECIIKSVAITDNCGADNCDVGESIDIDLEFTSSCFDKTPAGTVYVQVDAKSEDGSCNIEYDLEVADIQGMETTCTTDVCSESWTIPSLPAECKGKTVHAWAAGLYNNSIINEAYYLTSNTTSFPPGYGSFTFVIVGECDSVIIDGTEYFCGRDDGVCPEHFEDLSGATPVRPVCNGTCVDPNC